MTDVAAWLMTPEGVTWSARHASRDPSVFHAMIELKDDTRKGEILDHTWFANGSMFRLLLTFPGWDDLTWDPDRSP
jgi:hypothetical protein